MSGTLGPANAPTDPAHLLTRTTGGQQTVGAASNATNMSSIFQNMSGVAHRIFCGSSGNIAICRVNDGSTFTVYPVLQGTYIDGEIVAVGGTNQGSTQGMIWIPEL